MTVAELMAEVAYLGFDTRLTEEPQRRGFYAALNRAISEVSILRPNTARVPFVHSPVRNLTAGRITLFSGESERILFPGGTRSFSVRVAGDCTVVTTDGGSTHSDPVASGNRIVTLTGSVAHDGASVTITGGTCDLLSVYASPKNLPDGNVGEAGECGYDVGGAVENFVGFASPMLEKNGAPYRGRFRVEGKTVYLPADAPAGEYTAVLRVASRPISEEDDGELPLPLDPDLIPLLPELIASVLWLDDAPDKAAVYYDRYRRKFALLQSTLRANRAREVPEGNGW